MDGSLDQLCADRACESRGVDPVSMDERILHRSGAALRERDVVGRSTDVVGVAFDSDLPVRVTTQRIRDLLERRLGFFANAIAVEVEVNLIDIRATSFEQ